ncbi:MAG: 3-chlorobenzoate-3,4-dioxygenase [Planctomycetaceae bacterium]|jgi:predicted dehydrogenase|nr:3-chlorobenzoate-3,4-dioxygenase [Planctomycetaceae bacterium]MDP7274880.1 Gfo/Idh/MocA family oxidoreductase [Planctomycetaceae bacterium]
MAKKYRVGIIGRTGKGNYGHGLDVVWKDIDRCDVVAVADDNKSALPGALTRTGAKKSYLDYREMLEKEKPDIVSVSQRWLDRHHEMVMAAVSLGCHVYMEKPFVRDLVQADEIVKACEMRHVKLAIAHGNRYSPQVAIARKLIAAGEIGQVLEVRARGKEDARRGGGEDLWVLGTHMLDLMRALVGDVVDCYARCSEKGQPVNRSHVYEGNEGIGPLAADTIDAVYRFQDGVNGYFSSHRGHGGRFGLKVFGSKGVIEFQSGYLRTAWLLKDPAWSPGRSGASWQPISSNGVGKPETRSSKHRANAATVLDLIEAIEKDRQPISSVYDARAATEMIAGVFESHRVGGPVEFPLKNRKNPLTMLKR